MTLCGSWNMGLRCIHVLSCICCALIPRGCLWCQAVLVEAVGQVSSAYHIPLLSSVMHLDVWTTLTFKYMHYVLIIALLAGVVCTFCLVLVHSHSTAIPTSFVLPHWYMFIIHCCYNTIGSSMYCGY